MRLGQLEVDEEPLFALCRKWKITELAVFGSVLREDFTTESDIDLLVTFDEDARYSLFDLARAEREFETLIHRSIDLVDKQGLQQSKNWIRRQAILSTAEILYAA